ncbi:MAG TPA: SDR family oxidoreductase [bacterium]|nr:SDR family oxidoreductase [bacterium]HPN43673.1 SDR family oxidoreductase [bacterium]
MIKVVVAGCNGLLGRKLIDYAPTGYNIIGVDLPESCPALAAVNYFSQDLTDKKSVFRLLQEVKPDYIINAAAYTNVDGAETDRELCWRLNVELPEHLIYCARKLNFNIGHISTDYIFDGKQGPYTETARPNPLGYYGRSKLAAENLFAASAIDYFIVRTMVLYGERNNGKHNFVTWLIDQLENDKHVKIVNDQIGNTTLVDELAIGIWKLIALKFNGVVNIAGTEIINRFEFAQTIAQVFNLDTSLIQPITTAELHQAAPRPLKSGLIVDKAINELNIELSNVSGGLNKFKYMYKGKTSPEYQ